MARKSVLVTGDTGGMGKTTAIGLAALGARVGITGRDPARAEAAAASIRAASVVTSRAWSSSAAMATRPGSRGGAPPGGECYGPVADGMKRGLGGVLTTRRKVHMASDV
jgi:NAD(P)-dependent dehydrogenase (short-subunit alcohol dehydrogenase family)